MGDLSPGSTTKFGTALPPGKYRPLLLSPNDTGDGETVILMVD
jgi:hypothetical protein